MYTEKTPIQKLRPNYFDYTGIQYADYIGDIFSKRTEETHLLNPYSGDGKILFDCIPHVKTATGLEFNTFLVKYLRLLSIKEFDPDSLYDVWKIVEKIPDKITGNKSIFPKPERWVYTYWDKETLEALSWLYRHFSNAAVMHSTTSFVLDIVFYRFMRDFMVKVWNPNKMKYEAGKQVADVDRLKQTYIQHAAVFLDQFKQSIDPYMTILTGFGQDMKRYTGQKMFNMMIAELPVPDKSSILDYLRPYMHWGGYTDNDYPIIDWHSTGAYSAASSFQKNLKDYDPQFNLISNETFVEKTKGFKKNTAIYNFLLRYYVDMLLFLGNAKKTLSPCSPVHLFVRDVSIGRKKIDVPEIIVSICRANKYNNVRQNEISDGVVDVSFLT